VTILYNPTSLVVEKLLIWCLSREHLWRKPSSVEKLECIAQNEASTFVSWKIAEKGGLVRVNSQEDKHCCPMCELSTRCFKRGKKRVHTCAKCRLILQPPLSASASENPIRMEIRVSPKRTATTS
jgi:hypothetical protein